MKSSKVNLAKDKAKLSTTSLCPTPAPEFHYSIRKTIEAILNIFDYKRGYLLKQGMQVRNWKRRWFELRGNLLFYYKSPQYQDPSGVISLDGSSVLFAEDIIKKKNSFGIATRFRNYFLIAKDEFEMASWVESIQRTRCSESAHSKSMKLFNALNIVLSSLDEESNHCLTREDRYEKRRL